MTRKRMLTACGKRLSQVKIRSLYLSLFVDAGYMYILQLIDISYSIWRGKIGTDIGIKLLPVMQSHYCAT